ncbi:AMIN domain-containing protein [Fortiea contorta]|uniref:AMIN domain-containing protein n=1 Tax=Fortiea contorta TaxID=1892405 RepID=UPI0003487D3D|nr:AMIN domain-containing protein [Fortiea contorta]
MRKKIHSPWFHQFQISLFSLSTAILLQPSSSNAQPIAAPLAKLNDWRFYPEAIQLEFTLSAGVTPHHFYLAQPPRIVVDLPDTKLGYVPAQQSYSGAIQTVRVSQLNAGITRIVLDLAPGNFSDPQQLQLRPISPQNPTRWVLRPFIRGYSHSLQPRNYPPTPQNVPISPYNYAQTAPNLPPSSYNYPQPLNPLPSSTNTNPQQPFVTVPPLTPNNSSQLPSPILPPPTFSQPAGNFQNPGAIAKPNFPTPTVPGTTIIEFGQPIPQIRY